MTDHKSTFPNGLPWLAIAELPVQVHGINAGALAAHIGLPSASAWKWHLAWSPDTHSVVHTTIADIIATGCYPGRVPEDLDRDISMTLREVGKNDASRVLAEISTISDDAREVLQGVLDSVIGSPGTCVIAVSFSDHPDATAVIGFTRYVEIEGTSVNLVISPILVAGNDDDASLSAINAAFYQQTLCDLECLANGIWKSGVTATVACFLDAPEPGEEDDINEILSHLIDTAQDSLFGAEGWYAPDDADWDTMEMTATSVIELEILSSETVLQ